MMNRIMLIGRLTTIPEIKYTKSGKAVCSVVVAVERDVLDANGQRQSDFITVVFWEGLAERVGRWWVKGQWIGIEGQLQGRIYQDKEGKNRRSWEVVANKAHFVGPKPVQAAEDCKKENVTTEEHTYNVGDFEPLTDDDDVPF